MSVGFPFFDPRVKPLDSNGSPQAGCYYCFFLTGTLTPANVYADNLVTPLSQPTPGSVNPTGGTVADSAGRFAVMYLDPSVTYRAQLYSAAGILLEDTDPFKAPGSPNVSFGNGTSAAPGIAFSNYPGTGLYVPSANSLGFATNGLAAGSISQNQAWSIPAANGAATLTAAGASGFYAGVFNGNSTSANSFGVEIAAGTTSADVALLVENQAASATFLELFGDGHGTLGALSWTAAGGLTLAAGSSSSDYALIVENLAANATFLKVQGDGQTYVAAPTAATAGPTGMFQVGYADMPANSQTTGSYTLQLSDRGKVIIGNGLTGIVIPANASVAFPVGTTISILNRGSSIALSITTDTLVWYPSNTTGSRTISNTGGLCTLVKGASNEWYLTGVGIT